MTAALQVEEEEKLSLETKMRELRLTDASASARQDPRAVARRYQLMLCKKAKEENIIVYLETGCGKTLIAVLLMLEFKDRIKKPGRNVCVFLAPTVPLVEQQSEVIEKFSDFKVGQYSGEAKHSSNGHRNWIEELEKNEVLVMTPDILLHNLHHCFMSMELIELLIFDECHHAQKRHSYAQIMKEFFKKDNEKRPRIFGMTASPIIGKGGSDQLGYAKGITTLEHLLDAKVYTVTDRSELELYVPSPVMKVCYYDSKNDWGRGSIASCRNKLEDCRVQHISQVFCNGENVDMYKHDLKGNEKKIRSVNRLCGDLMYCLDAFGLWGAKQAVKILLAETVDNLNTNEDNVVNYARKSFLKDSHVILDPAFEEGGRSDDMMIPANMLVEPFFSSKVLALVEILQQYKNREDIKCIVFVQRIIAAQLLAEIISHAKDLDIWRCDFLVGYHAGLKTMSRAKMNKIVEAFRTGKVNLLVATNVAEEGLDIQTCSLVVRFDLPNTVASFIQSRGRARMPQSDYIFLVQRENFAEAKLVQHFLYGEEKMRKEVQYRTPEGAEPYEFEEDEIYTVDATKATISTGCSISLLFHYCSKLPKDEYSILAPEFFYFEEPGGVKCRINLPSNAPFRQVDGPLCSSEIQAKRLACLEACKRLHSVGALTDYLLPGKDEQDEENESCRCSDSKKSKGVEMNMELYEMLVPDALKGRWNRSTNPVFLHAYLLKFNPIPPDRKYAQFALFIESALPREAETMKVELRLARGRIVNTNLLPCKSLEFDPIQLRDAVHFQELYLRVMLDREDFLQDYVALGSEHGNSGNTSTSYLLLPVQLHDDNKELSIDWNIINYCLSSPIFGHSLQEVPAEVDNGDILRLANGCVPMQTIQNSLVLTTHNNSLYCIVDILHQINSNSRFSESKDYSYAEYFMKKHNVTLEYKEQPLLKAKQLLGLHNLLHERSQVNASSQVNQGDGSIVEYFVELPPELCCIKFVGFSSHLASAISLLPSFMHRLESFLVAIDLKESLAESFPEGSQITASRVLEAITTERCMEGFSLERLEVLGDAFLKYSVSRHLFLVHNNLDEGQLTRKRTNAIKNLNLYKRAKTKGFEKFIRDEYFDPKQYFALGRPCMEICTLENLNMIHYSEGDSTKPKADGASVKCSKHHHWMHIKTVADVVEALIGAYLVESGFKAALAFLKWIGIDIDFDPFCIEEACIASENNLSLINFINISGLERLTEHTFIHKGLVLEAFTHPSFNEHNGGCYQRLEFLGDAALDYIITSYLYSVYPELNPGYLTDMRSMTVSNEAFAYVAVRHQLHLYLIQKSDSLSSAVAKYVHFVEKFLNKEPYDELEPKCPKVLGDLVESFAGAMLLDTSFDLEYVWKMMLKILEPIVTPETLRLHPVRELIELCQYHDLKLEYEKERNGNESLVRAKVSGKNVCVVGIGVRPNTEVAKKFAAKDAITKIQDYRLFHPNKNLEIIVKKAHKRDAVLIGNDKTERQTPEAVMTRTEALHSEPSQDASSNDLYERNLITVPSVENNLAKHEHYLPILENNSFSRLQDEESEENMFLSNSTIQAIDEQFKSQIANISAEYPLASAQCLTVSAVSILHDICQKQRWESPVWDCCKEEGLPHQRSFTYMVLINLPGEIFLECFGEPEKSKKLAMASAARGALWWLNSEGYM